MNVVYGLDNIPPESTGRAVAVGMFDGVHWGHHAIFQRLLDSSVEGNLDPAVLTFEQHPAELLSPTRAPLYINTLDQRIELMEAAGVRQIIVADFNRHFANLTHREFASEILRDTLNARQVVVGSNFRFGKGREGDIRYLSAAAPRLGMTVIVVPAVIVAGGPVSSTRIRALISRGDVAGASKLLGRRFALRGSVVAGRQIGRSMGFPTANLQTAPRQLLPARGVYAVEVTIARTTYSGVCNIGSRPTFGGADESVEVHLTGFQGNIYGETLDVVFCRRIRDEMVFETPEHLADQIRRDLARANLPCD
ncbi:MAG: riboflavin biosynthesis protein RibF [Armatimonadetes bacterium RBG_16_58_9]|nr:MAG: riboflavin biosynthesis protein RibF [Armatimonadetes bacterium RBG_16_58_9]